jgi:hypothetical protein
VLGYCVRGILLLAGVNPEHRPMIDASNAT